MHNPKSSISVYVLMDVTTDFNIKDEKELLQFALEKLIIDGADAAVFENFAYKTQ